MIIKSISFCVAAAKKAQSPQIGLSRKQSPGKYDEVVKITCYTGLVDAVVSRVYDSSTLKAHGQDELLLVFSSELNFYNIGKNGPLLGRRFTIARLFFQFYNDFKAKCRKIALR